MSEKRPTLYLIDGHALAYRQYHATRDQRLSTSAGEPTGAIFGFARFLLDLLDRTPRPDYLAMVFDQGMSARDQVFTEYKSTRAKMDDDLEKQLSGIRTLVESFNIPILEKEGYEADDVIGTVARQAITRDVDVHIVTGDKDLLQLVNAHISAELPDYRSGKARHFDREGVIAYLGVRPEQIPDLKGLMGDNSDNIPGVPGIGEKTAVKLLEQYETLDNIYTRIEEQKGAQRQKLENGRESAFMSRQLATLMTDLDVRFDLQQCVAHDYDPLRVAEVFRSLEFKSLLRRLEKTHPDVFPPPEAPAQATLPENPDTSTDSAAQPESPALVVEVQTTSVQDAIRTHIVDDEESLAAMLQALSAGSGIAFDTETDSTEPMKAKLVGISLAVRDDEAYYIPVGHVPPDAGTLFSLENTEAIRQLPLERAIEALRPVLTDPRIPKYGHNAAFDMTMLRRYGIDIGPVTHDTMIAVALVAPDVESKSLKEQARLRFGIGMTKIDELIGKGKNQITMDRVAIDRVAPYAAADAAITFKLVGDTRQRLDKASMRKLFDDIEMPLVPVIVDLNMTGAKLDLHYLALLNREFVERLEQIKQQIYESVGQGFNIASLKQLNDILFDKLKLPTQGLRRSQHGWSLDAEALDSLRSHHPMIGLLLDWRSLEKLRNTYVEAMPPMVDTEGRIHTTYNQIGASTGRLSSESPNLQNIPIRTDEGRRVRKAFIAPQGMVLLSVDYSQVELRILAHYSQDAGLIDAFRQGLDIHKATAALVNNIPFDQVTKEQRYFAKRVNFGLMYGMGAQRLAREGELSRKEATAFIDNYFARLPGVRAYLDGSKTRATEQGYLETLFGRRRDFSILGQPGRLGGGDRARIEREAINMPIQGTNADIIKIAMVKISKRLKAEKPRARLILQVHDELVLEVPEDDVRETAAIVRGEMEGVCELAAPLRTEANVGPNWADLTPLAEWGK